jgi:hypothetical protein
MNKKNPNSGMGWDTDYFTPSNGDVLLELKTQTAKRYGKTYIWRMIVTDKDIKKIWPEDIDSECPHEEVLWAIDAKVRPITLCEECGEFAFGHKEEV